MVIKIMKSGLVIILLTVIGIGLYWYINPRINNKDFHLAYEVSNYKMNFFDARNKKINNDKYTFNNAIYYNEINNYKLTIHSLDFIKKDEKIIIVTEYLDKNKKHRVANITHKNEDSRYSPIKIRQKKDSVFIIQNLEHFNEKKENVIFEGKKR